MIFPLDWYRSPSEATPPLLIQPSNLFLCPCHLAEGCLSTSMNCCHHWCIQVAAQPATVSQLIQSSSIQWVSSICVWNSLDWALELSQSEWSLPGGAGSPMGLGWRQGCWVRENEVNLLITSNLGGQGPSFLPSLWVILPPAMRAMEIDFVGTQRICRGERQYPLSRGEQRRLFTVLGLETWLICLFHLPPRGKLCHKCFF